MTLETLRIHLASVETDLEHAKAAVYRCDGAIQVLQSLIKDEQETADLVPLECVDLAGPATN